MRGRLFAGFLLALLMALAGCGGKDQRKLLAGKITFAGQPFPFVVIVATGLDGKTAGGTTNEKGEYLIPEPPEGLLKFHFIAPASAGTKGNPSGPTLPARYASSTSGITFEYTGGKQNYDIDLKP